MRKRMTTGSVLQGAVLLATACLVAMPAAGQTGLVDTELELSAGSPFQGRESWDGSPQTGTIGGMLCWNNAGGTNPTQETIEFNIVAPSGPEWLELTLSDTQASAAPPIGPTAGAGCLDAEAFNVTVTFAAPSGVPNGTVDPVTLDFRVEATGSAGTFNAPAAETAQFVVPPPPPPPVVNETEEPEDADSPAPAVLAVVAGVLAAVYALRRRVSG